MNNSGSDFSTVKVGDRLWMRDNDFEGWCRVERVWLSSSYPIEVRLSDSQQRTLTLLGRERLNGPQVLFYDKVEIVPPPRPVRLVKKTMMVRPYWISSLKNAMGILVEPSDDPNMRWCGPAQPIEIEVEE